MNQQMKIGKGQFTHRREMVTLVTWDCRDLVRCQLDRLAKILAYFSSKI